MDEHIIQEADLSLLPLPTPGSDPFCGWYTLLLAPSYLWQGALLFAFLSPDPDVLPLISAACPSSPLPLSGMELMFLLPKPGPLHLLLAYCEDNPYGISDDGNGWNRFEGWPQPLRVPGRQLFR